MALCIDTGKGHVRTGRWQAAAVWVPGRVFISASGSARWTSAPRRVRNACRVIHPVSLWRFVMAANTIRLTFARIRGHFVEVIVWSGLHSSREQVTPDASGMPSVSLPWPQ